MIAKRPSRAEILGAMRPLIVDQLGVTLEQVQANTRLMEDLGVDSLDAVELVMAVEERFEVTVPEESEIEYPELRFIFTKPGFTVGDLVEIVYLQWGRGERKIWGERKTPPQLPNAPRLAPFTHFDRSRPDHFDGDFEPLSRNAEGYEVTKRMTDGMCTVSLPGAMVKFEDGSEQKIAPFAIDIEPVSATAYARFLTEIGPIDQPTQRLWFGHIDWDRRGIHLPLQRGGGGWRARPGTETWPMILVSWYGANAYALWAHGHSWKAFRDESTFLPTTAQFQYAARGAEPKRFPWGDDDATPDRVNVARHSFRQNYHAIGLPVSPVNVELGISPFGIRHMAGNVWNWCRNWLDPDTKRIRCERGGSWIGEAELAECAYGRGRAPFAMGRCLGFRCVRSLG